MFITMAMVSCGDKTSKSEVLNDSVMSAMKTMLQENDADGFSAAITQTQQAIEQLVKEGKTEEAQACALQLQEFITNNAESIKAVAGEDNELVNSVIETITSIPDGIKGDLDDLKEGVVDEYVNGVSDAVEDAKQQAVDAANQVVEDAKQKASDAVEDAKQKANDAVEDAKQKINQAVQDAEQQANDAADQAVDDAQNKANNAVNKAADKIKGKFKKK